MTENNYRRISSDTNKQVESHHEWTVKMTENLLPGKKAKGKFLMLNDNYHDWAAQSVDTSPPMDLMDDEIVIVDHNDSTCALKDEILKVTYNSMVGGFVPVGSSGLVRQAIAYGPIPYDDHGEVHLARCGAEISPTIVLEAHNCHSDSGAAIEAESKIVIVYIQGSTDNTIYREGAWHVIQTSANILFPVELTYVGGSDGDATTAASWTYDVDHAITGASLGSAVNPASSPHVWKRWAAGKVSKATAGLAYKNSSGDLVLTWINEVLVVESC